MNEPESDLMDGPDYAPANETGDVDLSLIDYNLSLSVAERIRQNSEALKLVRRLEEVRKQLGTSCRRS